jgi:ankyrin repeat protein
MLLKKGCEPNPQDKSGQTPIHLAFRFDHEGSIIKKLLEGGANPNILDKEGFKAHDRAYTLMSDMIMNDPRYKRIFI